MQSLLIKAGVSARCRIVCSADCTIEMARWERKQEKEERGRIKAWVKNKLISIFHLLGVLIVSI